MRRPPRYGDFGGCASHKLGAADYRCGFFVGVFDAQCNPVGYVHCIALISLLLSGFTGCTSHVLLIDAVFDSASRSHAIG